MFHFLVQQGFRVVQRVHSCLMLTLLCVIGATSHRAERHVAFLNFWPQKTQPLCTDVILPSYSIFLAPPFIYFRPSKLLCLMHLPHMSAVHADIWCEKKLLGLGISVFLLLLLNRKEFEQRSWLMRADRGVWCCEAGDVPRHVQGRRALGFL